MTEKELTASFLSRPRQAETKTLGRGWRASSRKRKRAGHRHDVGRIWLWKVFNELSRWSFPRDWSRCLLCRSPGDAGTRRWEILRCAVACYLSSSTPPSSPPLVLRERRKSVLRRNWNALRRPDCSCLTPPSLEPMLIKSRNWILSGISVN